MEVDRIQRLLTILADLHGRPAGEVVESVAALALEGDPDEWEEWLRTDARWRACLPQTRRLYSDYIVANERGEAERLLAMPPRRGAGFLEIAGEKARVGYMRVADMFEHVDFSQCRRFAMVGCGPLPVTALHVAERTAVPECMVVDCVEPSLKLTASLCERFGWDRLRPVLSDGISFDYAEADVVYIANLCSPKHEVVARVAATCRPGTQVVVRDAGSLGLLWAEQVEPALDVRFTVHGRGPLSRHLSRDVYLRRRAD